MENIRMIMIFMLKYFWFFAAAVGLLNMLTYRTKIRKLIKENPENEEALKNIFLNLFGTLVVPFLLLGLIQIVGRKEVVFYILSSNYSDLYLILSWITMFLAPALTCYWVIFKGGAKAQRLLMSGEVNEILVKLFSILPVIFILGGFIIGVLFGYFDKIPINEIINDLKTK